MFLKNSFYLLFLIIIGIVIVTIPYYIFIGENATPKTKNLTNTQFSIENAPSISLQANISSMSGNVAWQGRTAKFASLISTPIPLSQGDEILTEANGYAQINFKNLITVDLFSNTQLSIIQSLPINIVIEQKTGESLYTNYSNKTNLSIRSFDLLINLTKSTCKVLVNETMQTIRIQVDSGKVSLAYENISGDTKTLDLLSGQIVIFNNNSKKLIKL